MLVSVVSSYRVVESSSLHHDPIVAYRYPRDPIVAYRQSSRDPIVAYRQSSHDPIVAYRQSWRSSRVIDSRLPV